jgi:hypothetical protein
MACVSDAADAAGIVDAVGTISDKLPILLQGFAATMKEKVTDTSSRLLLKGTVLVGGWKSK